MVGTRSDRGSNVYPQSMLLVKLRINVNQFQPTKISFFTEEKCMNSNDILQDGYNRNISCNVCRYQNETN